MKKVFLSFVLAIISMFVVVLPSFAKTCYVFGFDIIPKYINNTMKITIDNVVQGSSAAKNGIKNGDIIKNINGKEFLESEYANVVEILYMNTILQILLEDSPQPIKVIADTPMSEKDLKTLKYLSKYAKFITKKNIKKGDISKGFLYLNKAIENDSSNVYLRYIRSNFLIEMIKDDFDYIKAGQILEDYLIIYDITNDPKYLEGIGYLYIKLDDPLNAEKYYNDAIKIINTKEIMKNAYHQLSYYYYEKNNIESAIKYYNKLLPLVNKEEQLKIYYVIAEKYKENNQIDKAIVYYNKYIALTKSKNEKQAIYAIISDYYANHYEYSNAINYWNKYLQISTSNKERIIAYQQIVDIYDKLGNYSLAIQNAQKILNLDSNNLYAVKYFVTYYMSKNNFSACIPYITKLIYLEPTEQYKYYLGRAILYDKLNNYTNSCKDAEIVYNGTNIRNQKLTALYIIIEANEKKIANSLNYNKNYLKIPSWKKIAPTIYTYVVGDEDNVAQYWANRRTNFYKNTQDCMLKYSGQNLIKCYTDVVKNEELLNNRYYYLAEVQRQQQERNLEYVRQKALLEEQYNNQRLLQNQLIDGLYRVQTAPQNINVNVNGNIQQDVNINGTMWHYYYQR